MAKVFEHERASDQAIRRASVLIARCRSGIDGSRNQLAFDCSSPASSQHQTIFAQVGET
jgi:hypothetical protein